MPRCASQITMLLFCDCCDMTYKTQKGLKNHRNKVHGINDPIIRSAKQSKAIPNSHKIDAVTQKHSLYVHVNEFYDLKNHVNTVLNSFSDAFLEALSTINDQISALKTQQVLVNIPESIPENISDDQFDATPQVTASWGDFETPKKRIVSKHKSAPKEVQFSMPLSNRFSHLTNDDDIEPRSEDPISEFEISNGASETRKDHATSTKNTTRYFPNQKPEHEKDLRRQKPPAARPPPNPERPLVAIIGDSTIKNITSFQVRGMLPKFPNKYSSPNIVVKPFLGARTKTIPKYFDAVLSELSQKPALVILHTGTNDIRDGTNPDEIKRHFKLAIEYFESMNIKVVVSMVTCRNDDWADRVTPVNHKLIELCNEFNLCYSGNENINVTHLNPSKYHLHKGGSEELATNFAHSINILFKNNNFINY